MAAIPSEEVVGGNSGGNGQVHGVTSGFGRQATCGEEEAGQFLGVGADRCARKRGQDRQSAPDLFWVSPAGFDHDFLGGQAGKARATPLLPVSRYLLVGRCDQVTARIGHQIANDACLNVNSFHMCRNGTLYSREFDAVFFRLPPQVQGRSISALQRCGLGLARLG